MTRPLDAEPVRSVFGRDFDDTIERPKMDTGPIAEALGYTLDHINRVEYQLADLALVIERLERSLAPVLTANGDDLGDLTRDEPGGNRAEDPETVDRRSTIARRIAALGHRADDIATVTGYLITRLAAIDTALELEGVAR